jgi:hypothetical protein
MMRTFLKGFLPALVLVILQLSAPVNGSGQTVNDTLSKDSIHRTSYDRHVADLGFGLGLDYGGLLGVKFAYLPIPNLSVFAAGGYYLFGFAWNTGVTWHILPSTSRYTLRPNIKIMYGVNGGTMVDGASEYNKLFYGFTPGAGLEIMFGKKKRNGIDFDLNFPIHGQDFYNQLDKMENDPMLTGVKKPPPVAFSLGFHHEF